MSDEREAAFTEWYQRTHGAYTPLTKQQVVQLNKVGADGECAAAKLTYNTNRLRDEAEAYAAYCLGRYHADTEARPKGDEDGKI